MDQSSYDWNDGGASSRLSDGDYGGGGEGGSSSRHTTHARGHGGLSYWVADGWRHARPFLPFVLISCLVVVLVYLLQHIVYGGPFTDPLFFSKFDQRWPRPGLQALANQEEELPVVDLVTPTTDGVQHQHHQQEQEVGEEGLGLGLM